MGERACSACGAPQVRAAGMCRRCYQRHLRARRTPAVCHPDRLVHARGLCRSCYKRGVESPRPTCHPERRVAARGLCSACYNSEPDVTEKRIRARRLKKYNLSAEQYSRLFDEQKGRCAICRSVAFAVDHDHATGQVRGLLCRSCNAGLGHFKDSVERLNAASLYLARNSGVHK